MRTMLHPPISEAALAASDIGGCNIAHLIYISTNMIFVVDIGVLKGFVVEDIGRVQKVVAVDIRGNNQCCGC